jgi:hypothetical protein
MGGGGTIVLGVTGHRVLPTTAALVEAVDDALDALGGGRDVHLLTSLAEGADRLVADRVLTRVGGTIAALLPLPTDDYERDFASGASVAAFRALLASATSVEVVAVEAPAADREARYEAAGFAVVDRSEGLVALWDGRPARGRGGTAEVVARARDLGRPVRVVEVVR